MTGKFSLAQLVSSYGIWSPNSSQSVTISFVSSSSFCLVLSNIIVKVNSLGNVWVIQPALMKDFGHISGSYTNLTIGIGDNGAALSIRLEGTSLTFRLSSLSASYPGAQIDPGDIQLYLYLHINPLI